ncbi:hypothetical protein D3C79_868230 [compost metagenome]
MCKAGLSLPPEGVTGVAREHALVIKPEPVDQEVGKAYRGEVVGLVVSGVDPDELAAILADPGGITLGLIIDDGEERRL